MPVLTNFTGCESARGGASGVCCMPIARRSAAEYPGSTRSAPLCAPTVSAHVYCGGLHHATQRYRAHRACEGTDRLLQPRVRGSLTNTIRKTPCGPGGLRRTFSGYRCKPFLVPSGPWQKLAITLYRQWPALVRPLERFAQFLGVCRA
jgi:hypothetical protein